MCGIVFYHSRHPDVELLRNILWQSRIRGMHAFGVALRLGNSEFYPRKFFTMKNAIDYLESSAFDTAILHTRYDTSGDWRVLENNQPVISKGNILVFNGVIRMCSQKEYETEFGRSYATDNDGEIILDMYINGMTSMATSLLSEGRVSFAGIFGVNGQVFTIRNQRRPMWYAENEKEQIVVSTRDILARSTKRPFDIFGEVPPMEVLPLC